MVRDAFAKYHPAVNLLFFAGAICCCALLQHPAYLLAGGVAGGSYYLLLHGKKGIGVLLGLVPLFCFITLINPILNTRGETLLFRLLGRPYTLEALVYGGAVAAVFVTVFLWVWCCGRVLTGDRFTALFGNLIPALSLLLVMTLRLIPALLRKAKQVREARTSIGKGVIGNAPVGQRLLAGFTELGVLTSWALEGSVVTGDSMRARGYGCGKRTSFQLSPLTGADWVLGSIMLVLLGTVAGFAAGGYMNAVFLPRWEFAPVMGGGGLGFAAYLGFLLIPTLLNAKERIEWNISKYRI